MRKNKRKIISVFLLILFVCFIQACSEKKAERVQWSVNMAQSEMKRFPEAWMIEKAKTPRWGYTHGCVVKAMLDLWEHTGDRIYFDYAKGYADSLITDEGTIRTYSMEKYNIDNINPGKILFRLYDETKKESYQMAIDTLVKQMKLQPRNNEGGFWHKKIYPWQMWLDGLYMASPFLAEYGKVIDEASYFDEVVHQIRLMDTHSYDEQTGLFYHAWDESRNQRWADQETGRSPNFWSRSIGWYALALVDVLDFLPTDHEGRGYILNLIERTAEGITRWQDNKTGVWYQLTALGDKEGNYLESSGSSMFVAFLYKAINNGYLTDIKYKIAADKGFDGLINEFIRLEEDGTYTITNCCAVAGLGGEKRYRDGSFDYYINEPVIDNDPKSVASFIWAAIAYEKNKQLY
ncbi:MAG: glycoside hydrolase family 88 protein [Bacteroidales bacterium]|nr:glycoside hydrolase family 88 protein [Bacteroidales bacterium]